MLRESIEMAGPIDVRQAAIAETEMVERLAPPQSWAIAYEIELLGRPSTTPDGSCDLFNLRFRTEPQRPPGRDG
jgi:hypothetical protein